MYDGTTDPTTLSAEERVSNGIALLDEHGPLGWRYTLDDTLDMFHDCVLDRVYGNYFTGKATLSVGGPSSCGNGFCPVSNQTGDPAKLKAAWLRLALGSEQA